MHQFTHDANPATRLNLLSKDPPETSNRTGEPLSQGYVLTLLATVAGDYLPEHILDQLRDVEPQGWYPGQALEDMLTILEQQNTKLPREIGKNMYYVLRPQFHAMGITTPDALLQGMPFMWPEVVRGASGEWRLTELTPGYGVMELEQPFNCQFEEGAIHGSMDACNAIDVVISHTQCMRQGAPCCRLEIRWRND